MKNTIIVLSCALLLLGVLGIFSMVDQLRLRKEIHQARIKKDQLMTTNDNLRKKLIEILGEYKQYNSFKYALREVSSIEYNKHSANCYDHAKLLQEKLRDYKIESSIFINKGRNHAWLAVWVDANTGFFIGSDNQYNLLEVRNNELEVICQSK